MNKLKSIILNIIERILKIIFKFKENEIDENISGNTVNNIDEEIKDVSLKGNRIIE